MISQRRPSSEVWLLLCDWLFFVFSTAKPDFVDLPKGLTVNDGAGASTSDLH